MLPRMSQPAGLVFSMWPRSDAALRAGVEVAGHDAEHGGLDGCRDR
jgi:hypothetical protein